MKTIESTVIWACAVLLGAPLAIACGNSEDDSEDVAETMVASSERAGLLIYANPYAPDMSGMANPITATASATMEAFDVDGSMRIELNVWGFPVDRTFGSHLHKLPCDDPLKAGGHYQHMPFPAGGMATDPTYANATNEAWLDFTTDDTGKAARELTVDWLPRPGEAQAIIFHNMASGVGGVSGPKLACLPITGF